MYRKFSQGWFKHFDFIVIDLLCVQFSFFAAAFWRHGGFPYYDKIYVNTAILLFFIDVLTCIFFSTYANVLRRGYLKEFRSTFLHTCFMNVLWIIILIATGNLQKAVLNEFLFSRGKFPTAYIFLFYLMFFCMVWKGNRYFPKRWKKSLFIIQAIGCIGICILIETSTGIIATLLFLMLTLLGKNLIRIIENPFVIVGLIIASMFLVFGLSAILQLPFVQNIIVNVLHEDLSLTGRMELYNLLYPLVMKSGLWGGGFGSYVAATLAYHGWYNAQNGLAEIILKYGFVGGVTFLTLVFISVAGDKSKNIMLYLAIFVFIIVAIVEVPFNNGFIFLLSLLQVQYDNKVDFIDGGNR